MDAALPDLPNGLNNEGIRVAYHMCLAEHYPPELVFHLIAVHNTLYHLVIFNLA